MWRWLRPEIAHADCCPGDRSNLSKEEVAEHMAKHNGEKARGHPPVVPQNESPTTDHSKGCPVDHENMSPDEIAAFMAQHKHAQARAQAQTQPSAGVAAGFSDKVEPSSGKGDTDGKLVYDVYGQELDPSNMMPATPNQLPSPGQKNRLSTERESSSIPKSGTPGESTWTYPSPQMFYNALKRKGKADDVEETDMESVVAIHNNMNEQTWNEVLEWERRFHCDDCANPKLRKFQGRPDDLSPAARFRSTFRGYPKPFDRHDWVVDRCGKQDVRYIIDYYYREHPVGADGPIELHVRPALDSVGAAWDRMRYGASLFQGALFPSSTDSVHQVPGGGMEISQAEVLPSPPGPSKAGSEAPVTDEEFTFLRDLKPELVEEISEEVKTDCGAIGMAAAQARSDPKAYEQANIALNYCMASKICKPQAKAFVEAMEEKPGSEKEAYTEMTSCLERFHIMARRVMLQSAGVAQLGPEK